MTPVKKSEAANAKIGADLESDELMPLDFMLAIMRDQYLPLSIRLKAAKAAAPFCHPKLASIQNSATAGTSHEEFVRALAQRVSDTRKRDS